MQNHGHDDDDVVGMDGNLCVCGNPTMDNNGESCDMHPDSSDHKQCVAHSWCKHDKYIQVGLVQFGLKIQLDLSCSKIITRYMTFLSIFMS